MKMIRLTLTILFAVCMMTALLEARGEETQKNIEKNNAKIEAEQKSLSCDPNSTLSCKTHAGHAADRTPCPGHHDPNDNCPNCRNRVACHEGQCVDGLCKDGTCRKCNGSCPKVCPVHGKDCKNDCLKNQYGYGTMQVCPGKTNGVCPVHGYEPCPHSRTEFAPFLRQALQPADRPYLGMQPLYVPREQYDPGFKPLFPRVRALLLAPPIQGYPPTGYPLQGYWENTPHGQVYRTTAPPAPMPTYTTRGPRDFFLDPKPQQARSAFNIGY
ncbi:MAG: hypothetical protein LBQ50_09940 [Planctomycetaceae bacterium]|nr:hypothetical protein [Planctomycetaceae bacterium]